MMKFQILYVLKSLLILVLLSEPFMIRYLKRRVISDWDYQINLSSLWSDNLNCFGNLIDDIEIIQGV